MRASTAFLLVLCAACSPSDDAAQSPKAEAAAAEPAAPAEPEAEPAVEEPEGLPDRDPQLAQRLVREEGALLLDVRSEAEFAEGAVDGATLIPHDQLPERLGEVGQLTGDDKQKPIVVYCRSGRRASVAKQTLLDAGYENVTNLGGLTDWPEEAAAPAGD